MRHPTGERVTFPFAQIGADFQNLIAGRQRTEAFELFQQTGGQRAAARTHLQQIRQPAHDQLRKGAGERLAEQRSHFGRGSEIAGGAEFARTGTVVAQTRCIERELHIAGKRDPSAIGGNVTTNQLVQALAVCKCLRRWGRQARHRVMVRHSRKIDKPIAGIVSYYMAMSEQVVLITGAARRVGAAIARRLHAAGARVVLHYRSAQSEAEQLAHSLESIRAGSVHLVQGDLLDTGFCEQLVARSLAHFGRLDALVNNASSFYATPIGSVSLAQWEDLMGTNLRAPLFLAQAAASALRAQQGCIVNITDIHAGQPLRGHSVYTLAKAGMAGLTRSLAMELAPRVRVNAVAPGAILWPDDEAAFGQTERGRIVDQTLLGRAGEPEDIARTVAFLINDAPYITGQIIAVDGGRSIYL